MVENRFRAHKTTSWEYSKRFESPFTNYITREIYWNFISVVAHFSEVRTTNLKLRKFEIDESVRYSQLSFDD